MSLLGKSQESKNSPGYMEQAPSRSHEASPQSGLGVGYELRVCVCGKSLNGIATRAPPPRYTWRHNRSRKPPEPRVKPPRKYPPQPIEN